MVDEFGARPRPRERDGSGRETRFTLFAFAASALLWVALTGAEPRTTVIGLPAALAAAFAARATRGWLYIPSAFRAPRFALWFLAEIFMSAWDVARRLVSRDPRIAPAVVVYALRLKGEGARAAFMNAVTLTPGTLSAGLDGDRLEVHALAPDDALQASLAELEARVGRVFGETPAEARA